MSQPAAEAMTDADRYQWCQENPDEFCAMVNDIYNEWNGEDARHFASDLTYYIDKAIEKNP